MGSFITLSDVQTQLDYYMAHYRHPNLPRLEVSLPYDLFPNEHEGLQAKFSGRWPKHNWPDCDCKGVYLILDCKLSVIYIGKASMHNTLGYRLSGYFAYTNDGTGRCRIVHSDWGVRPEFVATIAVPERMGFEAAALEEFLIDRLQPRENTHGIE